MTDFNQITNHFRINGYVESIVSLGNGLINDTFKVNTTDKGSSWLCVAAHQHGDIQGCRTFATQH